MKKKILITGGLGFLGVHCINKWINLNYEVHVIDNLSTSVVKPDHEAASGITFYENDILEVDWSELPSFDLILHLASPVGPVGVLKHSGRMGRIILDDIYWAIEGAKKNKCPLLFVSTSEIYGHRDGKTYLKEDGDKVLKGDFTVRNEYAIAKLLSEIVLCNQAKIDSDFKYQIIRPFNITGEFQLPDGGFVLPRFVTQALNGSDITVYYNGEQIRAFTWVKDIVEGIYLTSIAEEKHWNEEWNIGNAANEETIVYLAEKVKELTDSKSNISFVDPKDLHGPLFTEAPEKIPDSSKIESCLGWRPTKGVDEVIEEVVNYYKS
tara:strand:+ start:4991 stop:5956 length:966 start_codon:yes stop_codon:yes gene_type:complete